MPECGNSKQEIKKIILWVFFSLLLSTGFFVGCAFAMEAPPSSSLLLVDGEAEDGGNAENGLVPVRFSVVEPLISAILSMITGLLNGVSLNEDVVLERREGNVEPPTVLVSRSPEETILRPAVVFVNEDNFDPAPSSDSTGRGGGASDAEEGHSGGDEGEGASQNGQGSIQKSLFRAVIDRMKAVYSRNFDILKNFAAFYGAGTTVVTAIGSYVYEDSIKNATQQYDQDYEPDNNFEHCEVEVVVDSVEVFTDAWHKNVTKELYTTQNTLAEIIEGLGKSKSVFQTTGRLVRFMDPSCQCSPCEGNTKSQPHFLSGCLIDVLVQVNLLTIGALRQTNSDVNKFLNSEVPLSGYFRQVKEKQPKPQKVVFNVTLDRHLNSLELIYGEFLGFDVLEGTSQPSCGCQICPGKVTDASVNAGKIYVFMVNSSLSVIVAGIGIFIWVRFFRTAG